MFNKAFFKQVNNLASYDGEKIGPMLEEIKQTLGYFIQSRKYSDEELEKKLTVIMENKLEAGIILERLKRSQPRYLYELKERHLTEDQRKTKITINYVLH